MEKYYRLSTGNHPVPKLRRKVKETLCKSCKLRAEFLDPQQLNFNRATNLPIFSWKEFTVVRSDVLSVIHEYFSCANFWTCPAKLPKLKKTTNKKRREKDSIGDLTHVALAPKKMPSIVMRGRALAEFNVCKSCEQFSYFGGVSNTYILRQDLRSRRPLYITLPFYRMVFREDIVEQLKLIPSIGMLDKIEIETKSKPEDSLPIDLRRYKRKLLLKK